MICSPNLFIHPNKFQNVLFLSFSMTKNEMILNVKNIFVNLIGVWNFSRTIIDYLNKTEIPATGVVEFSSINETKCLYKEEGSLMINGKKISFTRKYYYCLEDELIKIYFADGVNYGSLFQTHQ